MELIQTFAGFFVGVLVGLTGVGGGALMTPLLVMLFGVPTLTAIGTDLLFAAITKSTGVFCHRKQGSIRWDVVGYLALGSIPGSLLSLLVLGSLRTSAVVEQLVTGLLGLCLILTAALILYKDRLRGIVLFPNLDYAAAERRRYLLVVVAGVLIGILVTLSSIGAGALTAAVIFLLFPTMDSRTLVGTDLAHALPLTMIAGAGHLGLGNVDLSLLWVLVIGSIPGVILGVRIGRRVPETLIRNGLACLLMLLGVKFIWF